MHRHMIANRKLTNHFEVAQNSSDLIKFTAKITFIVFLLLLRVNLPDHSPISADCEIKCPSCHTNHRWHMHVSFVYSRVPLFCYRYSAFFTSFCPLHSSSRLCSCAAHGVSSPHEIGSSPALESQELHSNFPFLTISSSASASCCSLFQLSALQVHACTFFSITFFNQFHFQKSERDYQKVAQKSHQHGDS